MEIAIVLSLISLASLILCAGLLPVIVVRLPEDYFAHPKRAVTWSERSLWANALVVVRSLIGGLLVVAGVVMLVLPGQGLLTILAGVLLADFPGKFRLERNLVHRPRILIGLNRIRERFGKPPLTLE